jgi:hypothetical protein
MASLPNLGWLQGKSLTVFVIAHGVKNSADLILIFLDKSSRSPAHRSLRLRSLVLWVDQAGTPGR